MVDQAAARRIAQTDLDPLLTLDDTGVRELREGWFFPYRAAGEPVFGNQGVIVNKATGQPLVLGSAFSVERDLALYDRGYQFARYDLVVLEVRRREPTLDALLELGLTAVEPTYDSGTVWRIARHLTRPELAERLRRLPCVFGDVALYPRIEVLEQARSAGHFRFEALEFRVRRA